MPRRSGLDNVTALLDHDTLDGVFARLKEHNMTIKELQQAVSRVSTGTHSQAEAHYRLDPLRNAASSPHQSNILELELAAFHKIL